MASPQLAALRQIIAQMPAGEPTTQERRDGWEASRALAPLPGDVIVEPVDAGSVPAEWISVPGGNASQTILYLRGGGYSFGSLGTHREVVQRICRASGCRTLNVAYRLAPENPFPAAVEDATLAYRWLLSQGVDPGNVVVAGDSAGGGLALALMIATRDAGEPLPRAAVVTSPWVDMTLSGESMKTRAADDPLIHEDWLRNCVADYVGDGDPRNALASPLYADLSGLPPLLIQVGECETLLDDSTRLAEQAKAAGVDVTLEVWPEMIHIWHIFAAMLPEGQQAIERIGEWVREKTASATTVA